MFSNGGVRFHLCICFLNSPEKERMFFLLKSLAFNMAASSTFPSECVVYLLLSCIYYLQNILWINILYMYATAFCAAFLPTSFNACPPGSFKRMEKIQARKKEVFGLEDQSDKRFLIILPKLELTWTNSMAEPLWKLR